MKMLVDENRVGWVNTTFNSYKVAALLKVSF